MVGKKAQEANSHLHTPTFQVLVLVCLQSFSRLSLPSSSGRKRGQGLELEPHHGATGSCVYGGDMGYLIGRRWRKDEGVYLHCNAGKKINVGKKSTCL